MQVAEERERGGKRERKRDFIVGNGSNRYTSCKSAKFLNVNFVQVPLFTKVVSRKFINKWPQDDLL